MRSDAAGATSDDWSDTTRGREIHAVFEDREGSLWAGGNEGLERYRDTVFLTWTPTDESADNTGPVYVDDKGRVWYGPSTGGLARLKDSKEETPPALAPGGNVVYSIAGGPGEQNRALCHRVCSQTRSKSIFRPGTAARVKLPAELYCRSAVVPKPLVATQRQGR